MINDSSAFIRAMGFLYLRFGCDPKRFEEWFMPYVNDPQPLKPSQWDDEVTVGDFLRDILLKMEYFETLFPRCPEGLRRKFMSCFAEMGLPDKARGNGGAGGEDRRPNEGKHDGMRRPASVKAALSVALGQKAPNRRGTKDNYGSRAGGGGEGRQEQGSSARERDRDYHHHQPRDRDSRDRDHRRAYDDRERSSFHGKDRDSRGGGGGGNSTSRRRHSPSRRDYRDYRERERRSRSRSRERDGGSRGGGPSHHPYNGQPSRSTSDVFGRSTADVFGSSATVAALSSSFLGGGEGKGTTLNSRYGDAYGKVSSSMRDDGGRKGHNHLISSNTERYRLGRR